MFIKAEDGRREQRRPRSIEPQEAYRLWAHLYPPHAHNELMRIEQEAMERVIRSTGASRALDVGTGTGRYLRVLRESGVPTIVGLDCSAAMLRRAADGSVPLVRGDAASLPIAPETFDLVVASLMVGDLADLKGWAREMSRVLRPQGSLVYSDFHPSWTERGWQRTFEGPDGREQRVTFHSHSFDQHRAALAAAGLEVAESRELPPNACVVLHAVRR